MRSAARNIIILPRRLEKYRCRQSEPGLQDGSTQEGACRQRSRRPVGACSRKAKRRGGGAGGKSPTEAQGWPVTAQATPPPRPGRNAEDRSIWAKQAHQLSPASLRGVTTLDVEPQQVVRGETESADRRSGTDTAMRPVPVVAVKPSRQFGCTFV
jgi:hypothetical protein